MKLNKYIFLCIAFVLLCTKIYSQNTFVKYFRYGNPESNCHGFDIKEDNNGNLIVLYRYFDLFSSKIDFGFFILNKFGDSLDTKVFHLDGDDYINNFEIDNNSTIYASGTRLNPTTLINELALYKINFNDSVNNIYRRYQNIDGNYYGLHMLKRDNSIYLTGSKKGAFSSSDFMIRKVGLNTLTKFDSTYSTILPETSYGSNFTLDENLVLTGSSQSGAPSQKSVLTMKVDTNGKEKWRTFTSMENLAGATHCESRGNGVVQATNGSYYIAGVTDNWCDKDMNNRGKNMSLLIKLDSNGNNVWIKKEKFGNYTFQNYGDIYFTPDGNLLCIGEVGKETPNLPQTDDIQILVTKYNLDGNVIWFREYGKPDFFEYDYGSYIAKDGGIVITGRYENLYNPFYDVQTYVMKLDDCGCLIPNCDPNCIASGIKESKKLHEIKVYPNPATNKLSIESNQNIDSYIIYNLLGEKQLEGRYKDNIDISMLSNGMYLIQIENTTTFSTIKFIKE